MRNPSAGKSTCITVSLMLPSTEGSRAATGSALAARRCRLRAAQNHAQIGLQPPLDGVVERESMGCAETSPFATLP